MIVSELPPKIRAVADALLTVSYGETVSYAALSEAAGEDVTRRRHILESAMKLAQQEGGAVFFNERNVGYRRLTADQIGEVVGAASRSRIRNTAKRGADAISSGLLRANDISETAKLRATSELAVLGLMQHLSADAAVIGLPPSTAPVSVADTLRATLERMA